MANSSEPSPHFKIEHFQFYFFVGLDWRALCKSIKIALVKQRNADFAVLITNVFPPKSSGSFVDGGVFVISPLALEVLTHSLRDGLRSVSSMRLSGGAKTKALQEIFNYVSSHGYQNKIRDLLSVLRQLNFDLKTDVKHHENAWRKRQSAYGEMWLDLNAIDDTVRALMAGQGRSIKAKKQKNKLEIFKLRLAA